MQINNLTIIYLFTSLYTTMSEVGHIEANQIDRKGANKLQSQELEEEKDNSLTEVQFSNNKLSKITVMMNKVTEFKYIKIIGYSVLLLLCLYFITLVVSAQRKAQTEKGNVATIIEKQQSEQNTNNYDPSTQNSNKNDINKQGIPVTSQKITQLKKQESTNLDPKFHPPRSEHTHQKLTFSYPTLGIPVVGKTFNKQVVTIAQLKKYQDAMAEIFKPYNDTDCELERFGDVAEGGYVLCKNFLNTSIAMINIGIEGRDKMGCDITTYHPMPNYQYDCTDPRVPVCLTNHGNNIFQTSCLGQKTEQTTTTQYYSLKDIVDIRNLTKKRITMKIDIEGGEFVGFRSFPIEYLDYIDQFLLQIHNFGPVVKQTPFWGNIDSIKSIGQKFVSVNLHTNNYACLPGYKTGTRGFASYALQLTMVNKKIIKLHSNSRSYAESPKNHYNTKQHPECPMKD